MWRTTKLLILAVVLLLAFGQAAQAALSEVGPVVPKTDPTFPNATPYNGFPMWYKDFNGVALELTKPPTGDGLNPPTQIYDPVVGTNPFSQQIGFGSEAFYYFCRANFTTKYGKAVATFGLEASFLNGTAVDGEQMVFARVRIKAPVRDVGAYKFYHPWGTETIVVSADDVASKKGISFTIDIGLVPLNFTGALAGTIGPFVKATAMAPGVLNTDWIGDGATVSTVTGSPDAAARASYDPNGYGLNAVRLEGPAGIDLDGKKNNFVSTNLFTVSGKIAKDTTVPVALNIERVTCSFPLGVEYIDAFLSSVPGAAITITTPSGITKSTSTVPPGVVEGQDPLTLAPTGKFYAHFPSTDQTISVTASATGFADSSANNIPVKDFINITSAVFNLTDPLNPSAGGTLNITATASSIGEPGLVLTAENYGPLSIAGNTATGAFALKTPPPSVTVQSNLFLGSDTTPVAIGPIGP